MKKVSLPVLIIIICALSCSPGSKNEGGVKEPESGELGDLYLTVYHEYKKAEAELDKLYKQILEEYSDVPFFKTRLEKAELAWIDFRDAQLDFLFRTESETPVEINSSTQYWLSMKELTESRITLLRIWLLEFNRVGAAPAE